MKVNSTDNSNAAPKSVITGGASAERSNPARAGVGDRRRQVAGHLTVLALLLGLFGWIFADALFRDRNFVYRDASQFYYPLLKLVQQEWNDGRWPLWNPHENAGMPLLGNPASAVLYLPRIILFQWLPVSYGTAFKWYTLIHVLGCAVGAWVLARRWNLSEFAAGVAALSYAFGAAVVFQYCNVIFLVGAAWIPFGLYTADRAFRAGDWRWACVHGLILAMPLFGGDPEAAYVTGGLSAIYVALIDRTFAWLMISAIAALYLIKWGIHQGPNIPSDPSELLLPAVALAALVAHVALAVHWWRSSPESQSRSEPSPWPRRYCLGLAALVALGVSAVQWIPSWEFGRISNRAAGGVHYEPYAFWIAPWRFAELVWPNVMGREFPTLSRWIEIISVDDKVWEPSLYFGSVPLLLALTAIGLRRTEHWRRWMSCILILSLWASMGPAGGVSWYWNTYRKWNANVGAGAAPAESDQPQGVPRARTAVQMQTPAGGLYWVMLEMLPGFDTFRYPAKLMTFTCIAFAILAGAGWDRLFSAVGPPPRRWLVGTIVGISATLAILALALRTPIIEWLGKSRLATEGSLYYGRLIPELSWSYFIVGVVTTAVAGAIILICQHCFQGARSKWVEAAVLLLVAIDVGIANRWLIVTATQASIDATPALVQVLRDAELQDPTDEPEVPMRIHRVSAWSPARWIKTSSPNRPEEMFEWEKDTIQPKHGLPFGINYTINEGTLEPYDYWWFFAPFYSNTTPEPRSVVYYPQRGFDMWGARYLVLPHGYKPDDQHRGFATFLPNSTLVAESDWTQDDYQVRRNQNAYPRGWIVHRVLYHRPIAGFNWLERNNLMREILYDGFDPLWRERDLDGQIQDPHRVAWIEDPDPVKVLALQDLTADSAADRCRIVHYQPDRVEVEAETAARGVLVLAELLYPGWRVTVDGTPSEILQTNRIMRGVALTPGSHRIVFTFEPLTVRIGGWITACSACAIVLAMLMSVVPWSRAAR